MKTWFVKVAVVMLAVALVAGACAPKPAEEGKPEIVNLEIQATSAAGTPPYEFALTVSQMINELNPSMRATAMEAMGSADAIHATDALPLERKKYVFMPTTTSTSQVEAWMGVPPYKRKFTDLKLVATFGGNGFAFATFDPNLKTSQDLVGKRLAINLKTMAPWPLAEALLRDGWGILDQVKISHHKPPDFKDILVTGVADAAWLAPAGFREGGKFGSPPYVMEVMGARKTYWVNVSQEDVDRINENNPWSLFRVVVPQGGFGGDNPPEESGFVGWDNYMVAWDVADDEVVYDLVKFLAENREEWATRTHGTPGGPEGIGTFRGMTEDKIHPGALRYYKEMGVKVTG